MLVAQSKAQQNRAVLDPWSLVHLSFGLATGLMDWRLRNLLLVATAYEAVEQVAERTGVGQRFFKTSGPENYANSAADVVLAVAGWYLGRTWNDGG